MPEISNVTSGWTLAGLAAVITLLLTLIGIVWRGGGRAAVVDAALIRIKDQEDCLRNLKTERANDREKDRVTLEGQLASLHAGIALLKERLGELRSEVSSHYATKGENEAVEMRVNNVITRIFAHIDQIQERMGAMEQRIIQAISDNRR